MPFRSRRVAVPRVLVTCVVVGVCITGCGADRETRLASQFVGDLNAHDYQSACAVMEPPVDVKFCARLLSQRLGCRQYSLGDPHKVRGAAKDANITGPHPNEIFDLDPIEATGVDLVVLLDGGAGHVVVLYNGTFLESKQQTERDLDYLSRAHRRLMPCP